jgi:hypothetical protein
MSRFTRFCLLLAGVALALGIYAETASGQLAPRRFVGRGGYGGYYGYDYGPYYPDINQTNAELQQAYNQERQYQAQSSMARTAAWRNINQTMIDQANQQTQSMLAQRQSAKDWWYQIEAQQVASRQAREAAQAAAAAKSESEDPYNNPQAAARNSAAKDIMVWPTLLRGPAFDQLRAEVEAPFRRGYADHKPLTADDYRGILRALDEMKAKLKDFSSRVVESEYVAVESYLDDLAADAQKRLEARLSPKAPADKVEAP